MNSDPGIPTVAPEDVGLSAVRLRRIDAVMQRYVDEGNLVSIVTMVCRQGKVAHFQCFGTQDQKVPTQRDTIFRIYSMTKPITTVAAMMLYEEGLFQLDDPGGGFHSGIERCEGLCRRGRATCGVGASHRDSAFDDPHLGADIRVFGHVAGQCDVQSGENFTPGPFDKTDGANAIDPAAGESTGRGVAVQRFDRCASGTLSKWCPACRSTRFFKTRIFEPLGMVDTGFWVREGQGHRFATNYGPAQGGGIRVIDDPATSKFSSPQKFFSGGGGLVSTAADYCRFCHLLLNEGAFRNVRLLGRKTVELMTMNHLPAAIMPISLGLSELPGEGFGLGGAVLLDIPASNSPGSVGTFRWGGAATTAFWVDYREELVGLLLTQFMPANHYRIRSEFKTLVYQAVVE